MNQNITLKKIAETLNLSVSTVSRALKNHPDISKNTKLKVEQLAKILEYEPNNIAIQLRTNTSKLFGLIVPSISNYFYYSFIAAVEKECNANGFSLLILQSTNDSVALTKNLQTCRQNRVNGVFVCTDTLQNLDEFYKLKLQKIPVIFFDKIPATKEFHKICLEDEKAAMLAADHIISKNKKNILALFGNIDLSITSKRLKSFKSAFQIVTSKQKLTIETNVDFKKAKTLTLHSLQKDKKIDCIFCMSDEILTGALRAVQESGKKYPEEVGIIAISNGFFPGLYFPEITYVETNGAKLGYLAFQQMILCIDNNILPEDIYAESKLIEGGSI